MPTVGFCKKCGEKDKLFGGLCENCRLEIEAKQHSSMAPERERKSKEEIERELSERKRDKRFWVGN